MKVTLQNALELGSQISVLLLDLFIRLCFDFCALHPPPKPPSYLPPQEGLGRVHLLAEPPGVGLAEPRPASGIRVLQPRERGRGLGLLKPSERQECLAQRGRDA